jgi:hypothetical protein
MNKYAIVCDVVNRFTDDPTLRTFFPLYLMSNSDEERKALNDRLWQDAEQFSEAEQNALREELEKSFARLPELVGQLHQKVMAAKQKESLALAS